MKEKQKKKINKNFGILTTKSKQFYKSILENIKRNMNK